MVQSWVPNDPSTYEDPYAWGVPPADRGRAPRALIVVGAVASIVLILLVVATVLILFVGDAGAAGGCGGG